MVDHGKVDCLHYKPTDHDMQGTEGSGSLGGLDVRRRIPIKLLSKQAVRSKPVTRSQRPTGRQGSTSQPIEEGAGSILIHLALNMHRCNYLSCCAGNVLPHL